VVESRWFVRLVPVIVGTFALVAIAVASSVAGTGTTAVAQCPGGRGLAEAVAPATRGDATVAGEAWHRLEPVLDDRGILNGQRLTAGRRHESQAITMDLRPESFAAGPFGGLVVVGSDDERRSELWALDATAACVHALGGATDVIRSATLSPTGDALFEHRVDRATRADLGVFRRSVTTGDVARVLTPFPVDDRAGRTFATVLTWSTDGTRLAVQACGALECRVRILDPDRRRETAAAHRTGPLIGLVGDRAIAYEPCLGFPCPITALDLRSGRRTELAAAAGRATIGWSDGEAVVVHERPGGRAIEVTSVDGAPIAVVAIPAGTRLAKALDGSAGNSPAGSFLIAPVSTSGQPLVDRAALVPIPSPTAHSSEVSR
jgi:hypothetical protein